MSHHLWEGPAENYLQGSGGPRALLMATRGGQSSAEGELSGLFCFLEARAL